MEKVITKDGSVTFFNKEVGDFYHALSGAAEESFEKYAKPLGVDQVKDPVIFDICSGMGYNAAAALDTITSNPTIYLFENDLEIMKMALEVNPKFKSYHHTQSLIRQFLEKKETTYNKDNISLILMFGDARKTINQVKEKADFIFFDPFSPSKVPDMWQEQFFKDIKSKSKPGARLATYSCARFVRNNMIAAGFKVEDGPKWGRNSPTTIATLI